MLYATWKTFTLTYDANGATSGTPPSVSGEYNSGDVVTVFGVGTLEKSGYIFDGWNTQSDGQGTTYQSGDSITFGNSDITLYAYWVSLFNYDVLGYPVPTYVRINGYNGTDLNIIIPDEIESCPVTEITNSAFYNMMLTSVVIPNSVTSIGDNAFKGNELTTLMIPESVTSIGQSAFEDNNLTTLTMSPNSATSIGYRAFCGNELTTITMPPHSVTSISDDAFRENEITTLMIPDGVISIGGYAFYGNNITSVTLPDTLVSIGHTNSSTLFLFLYGNNTFAYNELTSIVIPDSVTFICDGAFFGNQLTSITIGSNRTFSADAMGSYGASFRTYYANNGREAGVYTYSGSIWSWSPSE
jgi:uncharacterized repeat protein (TIGR02543 family)